MDIFSILFTNSPKITRFITFASIGLTLATFLDILSPLNLYYNNDLIFKQHQVSIYNLSIGDCLPTFFTSEIFQFHLFFIC